MLFYTKDHDGIDFLGINCCSTYKKASENPYFISICFYHNTLFISDIYVFFYASTVLSS